MSEQYRVPQPPKPGNPAAGISAANQVKILAKTFALNAIAAKFIKIPSGYNPDEPDGRSYLGTPVYTGIKFLSGRYEADGRQIEYPELSVDTVLMDVDLPKDVVKTKVQGRNGTVKEYISMSDYNINIKGLLVSPSADRVPKEELEKLRKICEAPVALNFICPFLDIFNIKSLVIEDLIVNQQEGYLNTIPFEIHAVSDEPFQIRLKK